MFTAVSTTPDNNTITLITNAEPRFLGVGVGIVGNGFPLLQSSVSQHIGFLGVGVGIVGNGFPLLQSSVSQHIASHLTVYPRFLLETHSPICPLL